MKKTKNLLVGLAIMISFFVFTKITKAEDLTLQGVKVVCKPESLEIDDNKISRCYLIARASGSAYALKTLVELTDLDLVSYDGSGEKNSHSTGISDLDSRVGIEAVIPGSTFDKTATGMENVSCTDETNFCVLFYTKDKGTGIISSDLSSGDIELEQDNYTILAYYDVALADTAESGTCGKICVFPFIYQTKNTSENDIIRADDSCYEITIEGDIPDNPESGAFVSYIVLAIGALIAVLAVALANKNNKFYKI